MLRMQCRQSNICYCFVLFAGSSHLRHMLHRIFQVLQTADREIMLDGLQSYLDTNFLPYLAECLPSGNSIADIVIQKALNYPLQVQIDNIKIIDWSNTQYTCLSHGFKQKQTCYKDCLNLCPFYECIFKITDQISHFYNI